MKNQKIVPRPYQIECLDVLSGVVESGTKQALIVMASGLGKTLTAAFAIERFFTGRDFGRVLVLCHSEVILSQSKSKFMSYFGEEYSYGMYTAEYKTKRRVDFLFATFQTMKKCRNQFMKDAFSYIIIDEAHHSHARTYFPTIKYFESEFLLGLTATPNRIDGQDISEIYGTPIYELDFIEAANRGLIAKCDYQLILDDLSQEKLDECFADDQKMSIAQLNRTVFLPKRDKEIVHLIEKYSADENNPKTIIFCKSIEHARRITSLMSDKATLVHKGRGRLVNDMALEAFRNGEIRTIVSVQMLNEGIDVPDANVIVFLRNTVSEAVFYQQLGRGTRRSPGKDKVKILDFVGNCERIQAILKLKDSINRCQGHSSDSGCAGGRSSFKQFTLDIVASEFRSEKVNIIEAIERAVENHRHWSNEELIAVLQRKRRELGRTPSTTEMNSDKKCPSPLTYIDHFGSWNNALTAAGLSPNGISNEYLLECLRDKARQIGRAPTFQEVELDDNMPAPSTYRSRFGSWAGAIREAGINFPYRTVAFSEGCNKEDMIQLLQEKAKKLGRTPTSREVNLDKMMPSSGTYLKKFGTWSNAVIAAGLKPRKSSGKRL